VLDFGAADRLHQTMGYCGSFLRLQPERISGSAEKPHHFNSTAAPAAILNDVPTLGVGGAFLDHHCLIAHNAAQEPNQRTLIVVQGRSLRYSHALHFTFAFIQARPDGLGIQTSVVREA
jgi:hypothetical protein